MYDFDTGEQINVKTGDKLIVKKVIMTLPESASRHMVTFIMNTDDGFNFSVPVACVGIAWGDCHLNTFERFAIDQIYKSRYKSS